MADTVISIKNLSKDYGSGRGVFNLNLDIQRGQVYGYIGTNGSGKTTTIRNIMGFIKPTEGHVEVMGMNAWEKSAEIKRMVSYVPGEIAFPSGFTGTQFLKQQAQFLGVKDFHYMNYLISSLKLDTSANLKSMSKGMKQKTAIVAALMGERKIIILDEPTTGLDPLMRDVFLKLILEEKQKGRTVFMSTHIFEEVEEVCDQVSMIRDGRLVDTVGLSEFRKPETKVFEITFSGEDEGKRFALDAQGRTDWIVKEEQEAAFVTMPRCDINLFLQQVKKYKITTLKEHKYTLEKHFMDVYEKAVREDKNEK